MDEQREAHEGGFAQFRAEWEAEWAQLSAGLAELGRRIAEQVAQAMAGINFEAIGREAAEAARRAAEASWTSTVGWRHSRAWRGPMHVHVDIGARAGQEEPAAPSDSRAQERMMVLNMVAEGKITAEEGARLLEALG
ncbi:MAG: hypothetical protein NZ528_00825 [Caldilineales bacterium]|nr:hypothetical protein [Caldilineales bacterium]MDW8316458.1 hypothetical protein [Anaerolineae bacterium]